MAHQFEVGVGEQVRDVGLGSGEEIVGANHLVTLPEQPLAQVGAKKARATGNEDALGCRCFHEGRAWILEGCESFADRILGESGDVVDA